MPYSRAELARHSEKIGRGWRTLLRWVARGCDLNDPESVAKFLAEAERKKTNVRRYQEARGKQPKASVASTVKPQRRSESNGDGELSAPGRRGAGAALRRLEEQEERGYARLQVALSSGDPIAVESAQTYWLRVAEVLRRLDRELEISRRSEQEMIPLKTAQDCVLFVSERLRISLSTFLSAEGLTLAGGFKTVGELKVYFIERFRGIMFLTLRNSGKTNSPVPCWALERIRTAFNIEEAQEPAVAGSVNPGP
jgi:hypothetical protein